MADTKISALTAIDAVAAADLLPIVDDPAGTPTSKKVTAAQIATYVESTLGLGTMAAETAADYTPTSGLGTAAAQDVEAFEAANADILKADEGDVLTAGYTSDDYANGTVTSGTVTPAPATGQENFQTLTNGGAFTLAPPAASCSVVIHVTNNGSAGTITTSGFTLVDGDSLTTTDTEEFLLYITKVSDVSRLTVAALQ